MIYTLTLNIAIDKYLDVKTLNIGNTNYYHNFNNVVGGKSVNVCKILNEFTQDYMLVSTIDKRNEQLIINELSNINKAIFIDDNSRINYKINNAGKITEINQEVQALTDACRTKLNDYLVSNITSNDFLLIAGSFNQQDKAFLINLCKEVNTSNIVIDSSGFNIDDLKTIAPLMIKPNEEEIEDLVASGKNLDEKIKLLLELGIKDVITTLGAQGVKYNLDDVIAPTPGEVINTVGAGDSFVGGYLYAKQMNYNLEKTINFAQACGSATAYSLGIAKKDQIIKICNELVDKI